MGACNWEPMGSYGKDSHTRESRNNRQGEWFEDRRDISRRPMLKNGPRKQAAMDFTKTHVSKYQISYDLERQYNLTL